MKRGLSDAFMQDLQSGKLQRLLQTVKEDDTLMLAIRDDIINIYYRGGNILELTAKSSEGVYTTSFDKDYSKIQDVRDKILQLPQKILDISHVDAWIDNFYFLKGIMDKFFSHNAKMEREFQQLVARENNDSPISNKTEYFIADIEIANRELGARFDMLAFKWLAGDRKKGNVRLALIEMKYGDNALDGTSGVEKHLADIASFAPKLKEFSKIAEVQINQLNELGLLRHSKGADRVFTIDEERFEAIFLFANSNPRSTKLSTVLEKFEVKLPENVDLRFFVANSAGYAMHDACMYTLDEYKAFAQRMLLRDK